MLGVYYKIITSFVVIATLLVSPLSSGFAANKSNQPLILIDGTHSNMGRLKKLKKFAVIADGMAKYIETTEQLARLMVFTNEGKRHCKSRHLNLRSLGKSGNDIVENIKALTPSKRISLTPVLKKAARKFGRKRPGHIIVVVGDEDRCNRNLCKSVKKLRLAGKKIRVSVVSLGVPATSQRQYQCVTRYTGGEYFNANSKIQFGLALRHMVVSSGKTAKAIVPGKPGVQNSNIAMAFPITVSAGSQFNIEVSGSFNPLDQLTLTGLDNQFIFSSYYITENKNTAYFFIAPSNPGVYIVSYIGQKDKTVLISRQLIVTEAVTAIDKVPPVIVGSRFSIKWKGANRQYDQLRIVNSLDQSKSLSYTFASMSFNNAANLIAPGKAGEYEIQYLDKNKIVLARTKLLVKPAVASITSDDKVVAGVQFYIKWKGPQNDYDKIQIITSDPDSKPVANLYTVQHKDRHHYLIAPDQPGNYQLRYITTDNKVLAVRSIEVVSPKVSFTKLAPAVAGSQIQVSWRGPNHKYDQIKIIDPAKPKQHLSAHFTHLHVMGNAYLFVPEQPGEYQVVYTTRTNRLLARTPLSVIKAKVSISAIDTIGAGKYFQVHWVGPANRYDQIKIVDLNDSKKEFYFIYVNTKNHSYVRLRAPKKAGQYQVQYLTSSKRILATTKLIVK